MSHNPIRPWRNIYRRKSRQIMVGSVPVGGDAPITVQTMTNTLTTDIKATIAQVQAAADALRAALASVADERSRVEIARRSDDQEIALALERAQASDFVARQSDGLATIVGERGRTLSGGERQRVSIASSTCG